jgi:Gram-negative bacterial TonB protein C-terminal
MLGERQDKKSPIIYCSVSLCLCGIFFALAISIVAQKVAIIAPETSTQASKYASHLSDHLSGRLHILDEDMSLAAFRSVKVHNAFNLIAKQAKEIGEVVGCEYFLLIRSATLRRTSFAKDEFYESYVTGFLVNGRSGRLIYWTLKKFEADTPSESERMLFTAAGSFAAEIVSHLDDAVKRGPTGTGSNPIEEVPDEGSAAAKNLRPPLPFKRIKPEYTRDAYFYDIRATVDALVDIDENGAVTAIEIDRWAGFMLDESVAETIRKMNWRPATRNGKALPMRVLLRYNFTKIERE